MSVDDEASGKSRDTWMAAIFAAGGDNGWQSLWFAMKWPVDAATEHAAASASRLTVEEQL